MVGAKQKVIVKAGLACVDSTGLCTLGVGGGEGTDGQMVLAGA